MVKQKKLLILQICFGGEFLGDIHKMGNAPGTENLSEEAKTE